MHLRKFVAMFRDRRRGVSSPALIEAHSQYLDKLSDAGVLLFWGPSMHNLGMMKIFLAPSKEDALEVLLRDPLVAAGVYDDFELYESPEDEGASPGTGDDPDGLFASLTDLESQLAACTSD